MAPVHFLKFAATYQKLLQSGSVWETIKGSSIALKSTNCLQQCEPFPICVTQRQMKKSNFLWPYSNNWKCIIKKAFLCVHPVLTHIWFLSDQLQPQHCAWTKSHCYFKYRKRLCIAHIYHLTVQSSKTVSLWQIQHLFLFIYNSPSRFLCFLNFWYLCLSPVTKFQDRACASHCTSVFCIPLSILICGCFLFFLSPIPSLLKGNAYDSWTDICILCCKKPLTLQWLY